MPETAHIEKNLLLSNTKIPRFFVFMAFEWSDDNATKLKFQNETGLSGLHISNHHNHHHNDHKLHNSGKVDLNRPRSHSYDATQRLKIKPSN